MLRCAACKKVNNLYQDQYCCAYCGHRHDPDTLDRYWDMLARREKLSRQFGNNLSILVISVTLLFLAIVYFETSKVNLSGAFVCGFIVFIFLDLRRQPWINKKFPGYKEMQKEYHKQVYGY